ncbi:MAG TPA: hypothetical protein VGM92_00965 [Candidatus Kapabacteria bacterium]|jgi:hypothetical protein
MKKEQKKKTLRESFEHYRAIARWNGESASELSKSIRRLAEGGSEFLMRIAQMQLNRYRSPRNMRFDYSELREPILAVDKKGCAVVGSLQAPRILQLVKI